MRLIAPGACGCRPPVDYYRATAQRHRRPSSSHPCRPTRTPVRSGSVQAAELPARTNTSDDSSCTKWCIICYRHVGSHIRCSIRTPPAGSKSIASPHQTCTLRHACPQTVWKVMDDPLACGAHIQRACPAHRRPRRGAPCAVPPGL